MPRSACGSSTEQLTTVNAEKVKLDQTLRQPGNAEVFQRSILLNALVERKAISWTRIFNDLEHVKPYNVRVVEIRLPKIHSHQEVSLDDDLRHGNLGAEPGSDEYPGRIALVRARGVGERGVSQPNPEAYQYHMTVEYGQKL